MIIVMVTMLIMTIVDDNVDEEIDDINTAGNDCADDDDCNNDGWS